ncbi:hypothetical protein BLNAU_21665 [Blattamonas nauphoetae]|uniref:Uncharacterized protein n=1 Tax=Blattamonas nauphoetae TaxID=2049346 RepID=A0ABQ9WVQ0_9EUKA|nr:hypothetical protein BLNAU_21665 [Blattamonas nauphoetae]
MSFTKVDTMMTEIGLRCEGGGQETHPYMLMRDSKDNLMSPGNEEEATQRVLERELDGLVVFPLLHLRLELEFYHFQNLLLQQQRLQSLPSAAILLAIPFGGIRICE